VAANRQPVHLATRLKLPWAATALTLILAGCPAWAAPSAQTLQGEVVNEKGDRIAEAVCTLTGRPLADQSLSNTTGEKGQFEFPGLLPGSYELTCAALTYQPVAHSGIEVTDTQAPFVQVVLPPEIVVHEKVEVRDKAGTISQESTAPPATVSAQQLRTLPLTEKKFQAALPLVPGVVRTPDGKINIKGSLETQGMLLVDSAETVDPVTGSFTIEVPFDAIESVEVRKTAYRAEYGRFSGGLTSVMTKAPSGQWHYEVNDFLPSLRIKGGHIVGIEDDSPRFNFTAPLLPNKLNFSEFLVYDFSRQPVRGLPWPHNEIRKEGFNSFSSFQYVISSQHLLTANINVFPMRRQFADINSLVPQTASSDYGQRGFTVSANDRLLLNSGGALSLLAKYTHFASYAHGQGSEDMLVTPNGRDGNFFNRWTRSSGQEEFVGTYQLPRRKFWGKHEFKLGASLNRRDYDGSSASSPVRVLRADGSLAEEITFSGPATLAADDTEFGLFAQDHWAFNDHLAADYGIRFSGQSIGEVAAIQPRAGLVYSPGTGGKTIFRAGAGLFNDRVPLLAGDFTRNPTRTVSFFDAAGLPLGDPIVFRNAYVKIDEKGRRIIPPGRDLGSTPYNLTWNLEVNQEIAPHLVARLSYLSSRTFDEFVVNPLAAPGTEPILLLTNTGGVRYHELESTVRYRPRQGADLNVSYVWSLARGDLNNLTSIYVPFEQPVIRPNFYANLPSNVPHRVVAWGRFKVPWKITASPILDWHSGFPYSKIDTLQNYVGDPNSQRLPRFFSLDLQLSKDFRLPLIPWAKNQLFRGSLHIFNVTNHANPRDVYNNITSPYFGHYVGFQHRFFDVSLDLMY
jgi:hypothetical protein